MWEPSDWLALAAVTVAGLSLAYTWWERRGARAESYRAALYERQLAVTEEFVELAFGGHVEVAEELTLARIARLRDRMTNFLESAPLLPNEVVEASQSWYDAIWDIAKSRQGQYDSERDYEGELEAAWLDFKDRVRHELGAPKLHRQVRQITGAGVGQRRPTGPKRED